MKKIIICCFGLLLGCTTCFAQREPLRGSGNIITQVLNDTGFSAIDLQDLDGQIIIAAGEAYGLRIAIDDNLQPLLQVTNRGGKLHLSLKGNRNNRMYIEDTHIQIYISLPHLDALVHNGNSSVRASGIDATYLEIKNGGNGTIQLKGRVADLVVNNRSNGNVYADSLLAQRAAVHCRGNGNVKINVADHLVAKASGNGSIVNRGAASFDRGSASSGNGRLIGGQ